MMRPNLRSRMPFQTGCVMLKTPLRLVSITSRHWSRRHLVEQRVAGDAGVVDQDVDRAELGLDLLDAGRAGVVVGDVDHLKTGMPVSALNLFAASSLPA